MIKNRKTLIVFLLVLIQSALAVTAGIAVLFYSSAKVVPAGVWVEDLYIGEMSYPNAIEAVEADYIEKIKLHSLLLEVDQGKIYDIPFFEIDANVDGNTTVQSLKLFKDIKDIPVLFKLYFGNYKPVLKPVINFNESKLRKELLKLSEEIYIPPSDAIIQYKDSIIEKRAETNGVSLNVANAVEVIRAQLADNPWETVRLTRARDFELQTVTPSVTMKDYDDIQQVISQYTTKIMDEELIECIEIAIDTINGVVLPAKDSGNNSTFSFVEYLKNKNADFENDSEGYDQVASTLYAALLVAGIPKDFIITRLAHKLSADYIEPGLDAWISGSAGDLKFTNPFNHKIAIFAQRENETVRVVIAGNRSDNKVKYELKTEIVQRFAPPIYNVESNSLKPGEKVVLNPGKEGVMVNVFRNGELFGTDKYEAEKSIVQIGPGTDWKSNGK